MLLICRQPIYDELTLMKPKNRPSSKPSPSAGKSPSASEVIMTELVLPQHTNALGTIFGGTVMSWIDIAGAIAAERHSRYFVVTASVDALHFLAPIRLGHIVHIRAKVNHVAKTSMEVGVRVDSENPRTGQMIHNVSAYTTFVALDDNGKPTVVPHLIPETADEKRRAEEAKRRRKYRTELAEEISRSRGET